jgi:hypothetical protein
MAVTEPERLALHAAARGTLGPEEGDALMASLPPANTDIATRQDLERLEQATRQDLAALEDRVQTYVWKVVIGTGVVLYVATVGTIAAIMAVLLQIVDR